MTELENNITVIIGVIAIWIVINILIWLGLKMVDEDESDII